MEKRRDRLETGGPGASGLVLRRAGFRRGLPQLPQAAGADALAFEEGNAPAAVAENAGGRVLLQDDGGAVGKDFHSLQLPDVHGAAQLGGQYDPAHFIDAAYDSC